MSWEVDMVGKFSDWLDERIAWRQVWNAIFLRKIPKVNWLFTLGSASLFLAVNQIFTGILLTIYYVPTPDHAYDSVMITPGAYGLADSTTIEGASAMVILVVHMLRIIFYSAYKFPRRSPFSGVLLLLT
jgi:quinol-cytochrome oxidoreductase complex cytochrome b subunit